MENTQGNFPQTRNPMTFEESSAQMMFERRKNHIARQISIKAKELNSAKNVLDKLERVSEET
ncbi:MAG: hypothetical protein H9W81_09850 [Enterococcus sp.]|nr:hypothetical protein [Enterococcus sp.]